MKLYLVRHGQTTGNIGDLYQTESTPLTKTGEAQAKRAAKRLKNLGVDLIYSSTHDRAQKTSEIISAVIGAKVELWDKLMEIRRPKEVRGKSVDDPEADKIMQEVIKNFDNPNWKYSDEENFYDLSARAKNVLDHLLEHHKGQTIVCVSHGTFIKFLAASVVFREKLTPELFDLFRHHVWAQNTGITKIEYNEKHGFRLLSWNDTSHL